MGIDTKTCHICGNPLHELRRVTRETPNGEVTVTDIFYICYKCDVPTRGKVGKVSRINQTKNKPR